jgi:hypothetical protein
MKEHYEPGCPRGILEEVEEDLRAEREALGVPIVFVAEVRQVLKVGLHGETIVESETFFTSKTADAIPEVWNPEDDDIPF